MTTDQIIELIIKAFELGNACGKIGVTFAKNPNDAGFYFDNATAREHWCSLITELKNRDEKTAEMTLAHIKSKYSQKRG